MYSSYSEKKKKKNNEKAGMTEIKAAVCREPVQWCHRIRRLGYRRSKLHLTIQLFSVSLATGTRENKLSGGEKKKHFANVISYNVLHISGLVLAYRHSNCLAHTAFLLGLKFIFPRSTYRDTVNPVTDIVLPRMKDLFPGHLYAELDTKH